MVPHPRATIVTPIPFLLNALPPLDHRTLICPQGSGSGPATSPHPLLGP